MSWLRSAKAFASLRPTAHTTPGCTRPYASGCTLCVEACPVGAISPFDEGVVIDPAACIGCGLCVPACPVDVIAGVGQQPSAIATALEAGRHVRCDAARILGPDEEGEFADVPCLAGVEAEALAAGTLAAGGASLVRGPCEQCPIGSGMLVGRTVERARAIVEGSGSEAQIAERVVEPEEKPKRRWGRKKRAPQRATHEVSRRSLFGMRAAEPEPDVEVPTGLAALAPTATARQTLLVAHDDPALPRLTATDDCTACGGCQGICPVQALTLDGGTLTFSAVDCVACGECVRICPEEALTLEAPLPGLEPVMLVHVEQGNCERCGRRLGPQESGLCHPCTTRASIVDDVWKHL